MKRTIIGLGIAPALFVSGVFLQAQLPAGAAGGGLKLTLRVDAAGVLKPRGMETWEPKKTAIIVCDMWDAHHCLNAVRRGRGNGPAHEPGAGKGPVHGRAHHPRPVELHGGLQGLSGPQIGPDALRRQPIFPRTSASGAHKIPERGEGQISHRPDRRRRGRRPGRARRVARQADQDGPQSQGPLEEANGRPQDLRSGRHQRFRRRDLEPARRHRGINNVILLGVHTNMCVLGRPFGLRQMAKNGKNVVLMRDMTDTMYNPTAGPVCLPFPRHRADHRAHREIRVPDHHLRPDHRRQAFPLQGRDGEKRSSWFLDLSFRVRYRETINPTPLFKRLLSRIFDDFICRFLERCPGLTAIAEVAAVLHQPDINDALARVDSHVGGQSRRRGRSRRRRW